MEGDRVADGYELQLRPGGERPGADSCRAGPSCPRSARTASARDCRSSSVDADVGVLPAGLDPHRRPDPLAPGQLRRGDLDLGVLITGECRLAVRMSPVVAPTVPITAWEEIAIAPSEIAVQFAPSPPSARLKSSEADVAGVSRAGDRDVGDVGRGHRARPGRHRAGLPGRVGLHRHAVGRAAGQRGRERERPVRASRLRLSPPLSCSTTVPDSPETVPPTEKDAAAAQDTATLVTLAEATVPDPADTVQVCPDGLVFTVTL